MPNSTVRANARTLPSDRRSFLARVAAAGALSAVPVAQALASPEHPDAALLALGPEIEAVERRYDEASAALEAAREAYTGLAPNEPVMPPVNKKALKRLIDDRFSGKLSPNSSPEVLAQYDPPDMSAYKQAREAWLSECERLGHETGLHDAEGVVADASDAWVALRDRVADTRAVTLEGMIFKAKHYFEDPDITASIVEDLLAMAEEDA